MPRSRNPTALPYHHGDLRQALIAATDRLLVERGAEHFSLREVARRAGVSPAAPAHHFGDAAGLLTAVAAIGFEALTEALREGDERGGDDPRACLREQGIGYVRFALGHPARFRLMFREQTLSPDAMLLRRADAAFDRLQNAVRRAFGLAVADSLDAAAWSALLALWSVVHGYAHLAAANRFDQLAAAAGQDRDGFVAGTLPGLLDNVIRGVLPLPGDDPVARR